jgi:di/tricarboxylate transporter
LSGLVNLDVAVVVAMPVAIRVARRTGIATGSLAIAVAATANASSFLLPTSNLTNLLVIDRAPIGFITYVRESLDPLGRRGDPCHRWVDVGTRPLPRACGGRANDERADRTAHRDARSPAAVPGGHTRLRALIGTGLVLPGGFAEQAGVGSLLAAGVNNLPAAAGVHALTASGAWATVLAMAIGPNLLLTGLRGDHHLPPDGTGGGSRLRPVRFSLVGVVLTPALLIVAFAGLHLSKIV